MNVSSLRGYSCSRLPASLRFMFCLRCLDLMFSSLSVLPAVVSWGLHALKWRRWWYTEESHTRTHTHSPHTDWQKHPGLPSFHAVITLPTSIVPSVRGWVSVLKLTFIGWFQARSQRRSKNPFFSYQVRCVVFAPNFYVGGQIVTGEWLKKAV